MNLSANSASLRRNLGFCLRLVAAVPRNLLYFSFGHECPRLAGLPRLQGCLFLNGLKLG
jgi:hypothetical protein